MKRGMKVMAVMLMAALGSSALAEGTKRGKVELTGKVNLNQATAAQLELLPGVGEKMAKLIVAYRDKQPFARIEDLVRVKGIGKKKLEKLKPYLSVSGETTLKENRSDPNDEQKDSASDG